MLQLRRNTAVKLGHDNNAIDPSTSTQVLVRVIEHYQIGLLESMVLVTLSTPMIVGLAIAFTLAASEVWRSISPQSWISD